MIKIRVPATSANIGPGFDALGLSLNLYNTFTIEEIEKGLEVTGCKECYSNEQNLVYKAMLETFKRIDYAPKGIKINVDAEIPILRGLGSSAACILGGVIGANHLAGDVLSKDEILELATYIEGHPDNVAAALLGGLVVCLRENDNIIYNNISIPDGIKFMALIPDFILSTEEARGVLPNNVLYKDAVYNISRVSILISSLLSGKFELLKHGLGDALHQPYRGGLIPNYFDIMKKCEEYGALGAYLSGAGPTIMGIVDKQDSEIIGLMHDYIKTLDNHWDIKELQIDLSGTIVTNNRL